MGRVNFNRQTDIIGKKNILDDELLDQKLSGKSSLIGNVFGVASAGVKSAQKGLDAAVKLEGGATRAIGGMGKFGAAAGKVAGAAGAIGGVVDTLRSKSTSSGALAGASAGLAFGPIGAGVGAVVGAAAGLLGAKAARKKEATRIEVQKLDKLAKIQGQSGRDEADLLMKLGQNMRIT